MIEKISEEKEHWRYPFSTIIRKLNLLIDAHNQSINKPVETTNEQPKSTLEELERPLKDFAAKNAPLERSNVAYLNGVADAFHFIKERLKV